MTKVTLDGADPERLLRITALGKDFSGAINLNRITDQGTSGVEFGKEGVGGVPLSTGVGGADRHSLSFTLRHRKGLSLSVCVDGTASD